MVLAARALTEQGQGEVDREFADAAPTARAQDPKSAGAHLLLMLVDAYRVTLSPLLGGFCRFWPELQRLRRGGDRAPWSLPGGASWRPDGFSAAIRFTPGDTTPYRRSRMEERRLLLAVALSLLVLTAYSMLFPPQPARPKATSPSASPATAPPPSPVAPPSPMALPAPRPPAPALATQVADEKERRIEVESPTGAMAFTNKGARLLSWQLARFKDKRGHAEEMVQAVAGGPRPLDLETGDPALDARLKEALFRASAETVQVPARRPSGA